MEGHWGKCNETGPEDRVGGRPHGLPADLRRKPMSNSSYRMEAEESAKEAYSSRVVISDEVTHSRHGWETGVSHTPARPSGSVGLWGHTAPCDWRITVHTRACTYPRTPPAACLRSQENHHTARPRPRRWCREPAAGRTPGLGGTLPYRPGAGREPQAGTLRQRHGWSSGDCGLCPALGSAPRTL